MKTKLLLALALVLGGGLAGCSTAPKSSVVYGLSWPDRETNGLPWPCPRSNAQIIKNRYDLASIKALGTEADIAAIREVITADRPRLNLRVEELRWLSPELTMAQVRTMEAEYFYVVEKKQGRWLVLAYYLKWIS